MATYSFLAHCKGHECREGRSSEAYGRGTAAWVYGRESWRRLKDVTDRERGAGQGIDNRYGATRVGETALYSPRNPDKHGIFVMPEGAVPLSTSERQDYYCSTFVGKIRLEFSIFLWPYSLGCGVRKCYRALGFFIYLLTAIGLTPGDSSTVHIYTQTVHRTTQWNRTHRIEHYLLTYSIQQSPSWEANWFCS